jgi:hypothetical protein
MFFDSRREDKRFWTEWSKSYTTACHRKRRYRDPISYVFFKPEIVSY